MHFRGGRRAIDPKVYPDLDGFFADLGEAYHKAVAAFGAAGCRYLQIDEVNIAYLCDPEQIASLKARGEHVENLLDIYARLLNQAIAGRPAGMVISMHLCRGNFRSTFVASGGYEPVAEVLFNQINSDAYFMEYDSDRAGGFEPLRFVPRGHKIVVLGLVTRKTGELESKDELKRRIDEAAKYLPLEQLALSPQCGFASTEEGNTADRGPAMGEAAAVRRGGAGGLGRGVGRGRTNLPLPLWEGAGGRACARLVERQRHWPWPVGPQRSGSDGRQPHSDEARGGFCHYFLTLLPERYFS